MIPKVINYIWLSNDKPNCLTKMCFRSWEKYAKNYEIKRWSLNDFNGLELPVFVMEALQTRKWAFACDYLRLYVLEKYGGIYLDSDVLMLNSPDEFLNNDFFSSVEYYPNLFEHDKCLVDDAGHTDARFISGMAIQAAIMGSMPHNNFVKECLHYYVDKHFVAEDGSFSTKMLAPHIYALVAGNYGFIYKNEEQMLKSGVHLYPSSYFAPGLNEADAQSRMVHLCNGSWRGMSMYERFINTMQKLRMIEEVKKQSLWK